MQITVYSNFSKRVNSTKQPTAGTGTAVDVVLKDECTIISPTFILNRLDFDINYVAAFGNYYFAYVKNLDGHRSEIVCSLDHMATFKTQIGSYSGFVEYAAASSNVVITDPRNKPTDIIAATPTTFSLSGITFNNVGGYIIGVLSNNVTGDVGVIDYYTMTSAQMQTFSQDLYNQSFIQRIQDQFTAAQDSLVSCIWLPITGIGGGSVPINIGRETMDNAQGGHIFDRVVSFTSGSTTLNFASGSGGSGADMTYLEKAPYCTGIVYLPFVGFVPIDMDIAAYYKNMTIDGAVDILTGDIAYNIRYGGGKVSTYNGNCATKIPISAASYDGVGIAAGAITAIGGIATAIATAATGGAAGAVAAGIGAAAGGGMSIAKSVELHTMINGANSSALGARLGTDPYAIIFQNVPAETNLTAFRSEQGMPYFKTATLGGLSGYIKCNDASISIPGDGEEQNVVNSYVNSGFYYE